jgi:hypothetical protein
MRLIRAGAGASSALARVTNPAAANAPLFVKNCRRDPQHEQARTSMDFLSLGIIFTRRLSASKGFDLRLLEHRSLARKEFGDLGSFVWHVNGHHIAHGDEFPSVGRATIMYGGSFFPKKIALAVNAV